VTAAGLCPGPRTVRGAHSAPTDPVAGFKGAPQRKGGKKRGMERGREERSRGMGRRGMEVGTGPPIG